MHFTTLFYAHTIAPIVNYVVPFTACATSGARPERPETHFTVEFIVVQDLFTVVKAQFEPSETVIREYWFTGYYAVSILEIHTEAFLWYILISDETTETALGYWGPICLLSSSPFLPLRPVISLVVIVVGSVIPWLILLLF